jgi:endonuclease-3
MNREALRRMGWVISRMESLARRLGAPVLEAERMSRQSPFKILVFTMLSSRTKDEATMKAVGRLFAKARTPRGISSLGRKRLERILYGVGFHRVKAKNLLAMCRMLEGRPVPRTREGLMGLPGVGRKTANIVLARAFGKNTLGVDVHVHRISNRLGLVRTKKPEKTEEALVVIVPPELLGKLNRAFVAFGQTVCTPRAPKCRTCPLNRLCWRAGVREFCPECRFSLGNPRRE